jgi:phosphatidylserine decarboxylase
MPFSRLSPSDIHRLHASVSGRVVRVARRGSRFMASEFAAVHSRMDIMSENDRIVMEFDSREFGTVVQVRMYTGLVSMKGICLACTDGGAGASLRHEETCLYAA